MNKEELVRAIARQTGLKQKVSLAALEAMLEVIQTTISNKQKLVLVGFGTFASRQAAARRAVNPRTQEVMLVPARTVPVFKAGKDLKVLVAGKRPEPVPEPTEEESAPKAKKKTAKK